MIKFKIIDGGRPTYKKKQILNFSAGLFVDEADDLVLTLNGVNVVYIKGDTGQYGLLGADNEDERQRLWPIELNGFGCLSKEE